MDTIDIGPSSVAEVFAAPNIDSVLAEYAAESSIAGLPAATPNRDMYAQLEATGFMQVVAAWQGEQLAGFIVLVVTPNPHYSQAIAVSESFFVAAKYRKTGAGLQLLGVAEILARQKGAVGMFVSAPVGSRLAQIMPRVGYPATTQAFFRSLK